MKLMASGVTNSAASVRSPSFSRSSSSTTTIIRPARISSSAPGTSVNGASIERGVCGMAAFLFSPMEDENGKVGAPSKATSQGLKSKSAAQRAALLLNRPKKKGLQRRFNLETPCFEQGFRDILGILV